MSTNISGITDNLRQFGCSEAFICILLHIVVAFDELSQNLPNSVSKAMETLLKYDYPDYPNEFEVPSATSLMRELQAIPDKDLVLVINQMI